MNMNLEPDHATDAETVEQGRYRILIDSITDYAIFLLDAEGNVATWNSGAQQIKGYTAEEIIGRHFSTFYTQKDIASEYPAFELKEAVKRGRFEDEGWRVKKDGSTFWANVVITPVYDNKKQLIGFSKITRDLSQRKKAEDDLFRAYEELKESEERFRLLIEGVTDYAIFMLDPGGNVATWNAGARRMNGYESHEIIGKYFAKFYSKEHVEEGYPAYELNQARLNGSFEDSGWRYRKDGTAFWANTVITPIYNAEKELIGFSKITRDLTDRKKMERQLFQVNEELKESEERSRLLIESVKDYAILMLNPEGVVMSWNVGAERIKGYKTDEIVGRHFSLFYDRESIARGFPQYELKKAQEIGRFEDEGWRIRKDGTAFWANVVITPIYNAGNRLLGFSKVTRDLTERRRNEELMLKNNELIKINNELDNFVYAASHDLKAPILNLEGLLEALKEDLSTDLDKHQDVLTRMSKSIETLKHVISDLGDVTKLNKISDAPEDVHIPGILKEICISLQPLIERNRVEIKLGTMEVETLRYIRKNLRSVLFNLISNAIKYTDPRRQPQVEISTFKSETGEVVLKVKDNGLGIAPSQKGKIFSLFKRAHDHVEGSGIGLYLVKRILDNAGDSISVESIEGQGSTFIVQFQQA